MISDYSAMTLTLRVISAQCQELGPDCSRQFDAHGGRIGRCDDNDWVLPDPDRYLSSYHAQISCDAGRWILEDLSTNGVYVNNATLPLSQLGPYELHEGDQIRMGDYQILVSLETQVAEKISDALHKSNKDKKTPRKAIVNVPAADHELNLNLDLSELFSGKTYPPTKGRPAHGKQDLPRHDNALFNTLEKTAPRRQLPLQPDVSEEPVTVTMNETSIHGLAAFCRGAGIDIDELSSHSETGLLTLAGQLLRATVIEMAALEKPPSESLTTSETIYLIEKSTADHLVKKSSDVDETLIRLLNSVGTLRTNPVESIRKRFHDLRHHEQATLSAISTAIDKLMAQINPNELQPRFDRILSRSKGKKLETQQQYWSMYSELFQTINQRTKDGLPLSFAEEFALAYQTRFRELAHQDKERTK